MAKTIFLAQVFRLVVASNVSLFVIKDYLYSTTIELFFRLCCVKKLGVLNARLAPC